MKRALRKEMIQARTALSEDVMKEKSHAILDRIMASARLNDFDTVMIFMDFRKEVQTQPIIEWLWNKGKNGCHSTCQKRQRYLRTLYYS